MVAWNLRFVAVACLTVLLIGCDASTPPETTSTPSPNPGRQVVDRNEPAGANQVAQAPELPMEPLGTISTELAVVDSAETPQPEKKQGREPIYDPSANARADIRTAVERAKIGHKRVLVKFGGNWCSWCFKLHDVFKKDAEIAPIVASEYELVLVDVNTNQDLKEEYDPQNVQSFPWLTVLDDEGRVLANQNTGDLETGPSHDSAKVKAFLTKWQAPQIDAKQVLAERLTEARENNKRVLLHVGAPGCSWCRVLDRFLFDHRELINVDYVDLKIDTDRMIHGDEIAASFRNNDHGGIPWFAILDADGKTLVTSDGPNGNIGYPFQPQEIEYFVSMLNQTRRAMTDEQIASLERHLREYAASRKSTAH